MFTRLPNDMWVLVVILLFVGLVAASVRHDRFQRSMGIAALGIALILGSCLLFSPKAKTASAEISPQKGIATVSK